MAQGQIVGTPLIRLKKDVDQIAIDNVEREGLVIRCHVSRRLPRAMSKISNEK